MPAYSPPRARAKNTIGHPPPARLPDRLRRHRFRQRLHVVQMAQDALALAGRYLLEGVPRLARQWWRWADFTLVPTVAWAAGYATGMPWWVAYHAAVAWLAGRLWLEVGGLPWWSPWHPRRQPWPIRNRVAARRRSHQQRELARRVTPTPKVKWVEEAGYATILKVTPPPLVHPDSMESLSPVLSESYGQRVTVERGSRPGQWQLVRHNDELLAKEPVYRHMPIVTSRHVPIGVDWRGGMVTVPLLEASLMIAGQRGSGKSSTLNAALARALMFPYLDLYIFDAKDGMDLQPWYRFAHGEPAVDVDQALDLLAERLDGHHSRSRELGRAGLGLVTPTADWPLRLILLDEFATLVDHPVKKTRDRARWLIGELNRLGRATGDIIWAATQDIRAEVITGKIRSQFTHKLGLRVDTVDDSVIVMGRGSTGRGVNLATVPADQPGRGFLRGGMPTFRELRTFRLYGQQLNDELAIVGRERSAHSSGKPPAGSAHGPKTVPPELCHDMSPRTLPFSARSADPGSAHRTRQRIARLVETIPPDDLTTERVAREAGGISQEMARRHLRSLGLVPHGHRRGRWGRAA